MSWWVADAWQIGPIFLFSWVVWVIGSIILHELGHGWTAVRLGDMTPIVTGHMTFNPMVHMGPVSLICFGLFGFTWGLMPVDPSRLRGKYADAQVAAAGPAVNLGLFVLCTICELAWMKFGGFSGDRIYNNVRTFFYLGMVINCIGVLFNLLPVPPLDGSRILADFLPVYRRLFETHQGRMYAMIGFLALFWFGANTIWNAVFWITNAVLRTLGSMLHIVPMS